jgi:hypothetical protein
MPQRQAPKPEDFGVRVKGRDFTRAYLKLMDKHFNGVRRGYNPPQGMRDFAKAWVNFYMGDAWGLPQDGKNNLEFSKESAC